jgi:hypothetical protein
VVFLSTFDGVLTGPKVAAPLGAANPGAGVAGGKEPGVYLIQHQVDPQQEVGPILRPAGGGQALQFRLFIVHQDLQADLPRLLPGLVGHQAGIEGELQGLVRVLGPLALVRGLEIREPVVGGEDIDGALEG